VGVLGCGNVGAAFVALVDSGADSISGRTGISLEVTRIAVRDPSRDRPGIDRVAFEKRVTTDAHAIVADPEIDLVVELIGGVEPARTLILEALASKKPVVSGNKELLSTSAGELSRAAELAGVDLLFEASVAGAIPLVRLLRESLAGEHIVRLTGIVNGTTNYMLTRMSEEGLGYSEALGEAQALGYAEADPTADVEGYDAAAKAAILAGIAFDADVRAGDVHREGITGVTQSDIAFAHRLGYEVKLLAIAERSVVPDASTVGGGHRGLDADVAEGGGRAGHRGLDADVAEGGGRAGHRGPDADVAETVGAPASPGAPSVAVRVHPAMVPKGHPLASVRGSFNAVFVEGDAAGELMVYGRGAGGRPTASAVLGDVIDAAHHLREGSRARSARRRIPDLRSIAELHSQYYLTLDVLDRPGVLAAVASVFGEHRVSIRSMEQTGLSGEARLVFITHTALEADFSATLQALSELDSVERIGSVLRVIGPEPSGP
jgi:homoserine dehydrogenase